MVSGIRIADECITTYQQLKLGEKKFKYILFTLNDDLTGIVVEKTSDASSYETFIEDLPKDHCCWAIYDFEFEKDGKRNKLCLVSWSPDDASIKNKMVFASSHWSLKMMLDGIAFAVQATDRSEISYGTVLAKALMTTH